MAEICLKGMSSTGKAVAEARAFVSYAAALFHPGGTVIRLVGYTLEPGDVGVRSAEEIDVLIEEARRELDRQDKRNESIRDTAKTVLPVCLASLAVSTGLLGRVRESDGVWPWMVWCLGLLLTALAALGSGSLLAVRAEFGAIDVNVLTTLGDATRRALAGEYVKSIGLGEDTITTRLSVMRIAVTLILVGSALSVLTWVLVQGA